MPCCDTQYADMSDVPCPCLSVLISDCSLISAPPSLTQTRRPERSEVDARAMSMSACGDMSSRLAGLIASRKQEHSP